MATARVWDRYLSERDKLHLQTTQHEGVRFGFGRRPTLLLIDLYRGVFGDRPQPIFEAMKEWPALLTKRALNLGGEPFQTYHKFREYRNSLVHGSIASSMRSVRGLVQSMETIEKADEAWKIVDQVNDKISEHFHIT